MTLVALASGLVLAPHRASVSQVALPVPLPSVELPRMDPPIVTVDTPRAGLRVDARRLRAERLLDAHRDVLDVDVHGALVVRDEVLAYDPSPASLDRASSAGFTVRRRSELEGLGVTIVVLQAPVGVSARQALKRLRRLDSEGVYDLNHVYLDSGDASRVADTAAASRSPRAGGAGAGAAPAIGLIDGGIATTHPSLQGATARTHGCDGRNITSSHGTAVASLLLQTLHAATQSAEPVSLYAADVYCGVPTGGGVDAVLDALAWMARERVPVINVSLVGPPNALLERGIAALLARGQTIVAAVGNDGPAAPPLYPAAYPGVVAVTAVDRSRRVLLEAGRGSFVAFAAIGADTMAATPPDGQASVRGTSFAAPVVAGLLACRITRPERALAEAAVRSLAASATDLGARGRDPVYGHGLVGVDATGDRALCAIKNFVTDAE
jgi:hypothetical protein